ncbi:MAG: N-(5'-phosphoribosyl)anthranilate isomerase [Campylobacteraceae bacterium 4484_166]|nr:MAG: N-(5'-phosphoribosyl)anthranilate isomerase [Campylobacteraceae bacterium 4484_166]
MVVKICGITNIKDAIDSINSGADALGFVFYKKSPRYITPQKVKEIINELDPFVKFVGLFVNHTVDEINNISKISGIDIAQLHFSCDEKFKNSLEVKYIEVIRAKSKADIKLNKNKFYIVDSFVEQYGGQGRAVELSWFENQDNSHIILAGGLNPENLLTLKDFGFYGVDVSSGVESCVGKKEKQKLIKFCKVAKSIS